MRFYKIWVWDEFPKDIAYCKKFLEHILLVIFLLIIYKQQNDLIYVDLMVQLVSTYSFYI